MSEVFVRFVIRDTDEMSGYRQGFFTEAYRLRRERHLQADEHQKLDELLKWLGKNLDVPKRFNRSRSKGSWRRDTRGICWFKTGSTEHVSKAQQVAQIMRRNGIDIFELKSDRPGFLVFEDAHQIVAEPFSDVAGLK
jgi:hypothetical protein